MSAAELRERRERLGLSLTDLGEALGVDRMTIWRWEKGERAIPPYLTLALTQLEQERPRP